MQTNTAVKLLYLRNNIGDTGANSLASTLKVTRELQAPVCVLLACFCLVCIVDGYPLPSDNHNTPCSFVHMSVFAGKSESDFPAIGSLSDRTQRGNFSWCCSEGVLCSCNCICFLFLTVLLNDICVVLVTTHCV